MGVYINSPNFGALIKIVGDILESVIAFRRRQWGYYQELYDLYSFDFIVEKARNLVDPLYEDNNPTPDDIEQLIDDEGLWVF